jgi:hypothetical protein
MVALSEICESYEIEYTTGGRGVSSGKWTNMDKNNFFSGHLWPILLGAGCALPEIVNGATFWLLAVGAALGWAVWRSPRWWARWTRAGG